MAEMKHNVPLAMNFYFTVSCLKCGLLSIAVFFRNYCRAFLFVCLFVCYCFLIIKIIILSNFEHY